MIIGGVEIPLPDDDYEPESDEDIRDRYRYTSRGMPPGEDEPNPGNDDSFYNHRDYFRRGMNDEPAAGRYDRAREHG